MSIEVKQMVVKSDIKTDDEDDKAQIKAGGGAASSGENMDCNQAKSVVVEDCMRQIKRIFQQPRER
jgi:hypothetical protein